jgi:RimJ/RimL family protein N-acetyltransferase
MQHIETSRLYIRQFSIDDHEFIIKLLNTPDWHTYVGNRNITSENESRNYISNIILKSYTLHGFGPMTVCLKPDMTPIGMAGILKRDHLNFPDIGYALLPEYYGRGYAIEAVHAILNYVFNELKVSVILAVTAANNMKSKSLLTKLDYTSVEQSESGSLLIFTFRNNIIKTSRLCLRYITKYDNQFIIELLNSPDWLRYIGDRNVHNTHDAEMYVINGPLKSYNTNGFGLLLVETADTFIPIGICGCLVRDTLLHPDLGYAFLPQYTGMGYAAESASAVIDFMTRNFDYSKILAITLPSNDRSIHLLEKLHFHVQTTPNTYSKIPPEVIDQPKSDLLTFSLEIQNSIHDS